MVEEVPASSLEETARAPNCTYIQNHVAQTEVSNGPVDESEFVRTTRVRDAQLSLRVSGERGLTVQGVGCAAVLHVPCSFMPYCLLLRSTRFIAASHARGIH